MAGRALLNLGLVEPAEVAHEATDDRDESEP